jgi:hypothetical protein
MRQLRGRTQRVDGGWTDAKPRCRLPDGHERRRGAALSDSPSPMRFLDQGWTKCLGKKNVWKEVNSGHSYLHATQGINGLNAVERSGRVAHGLSRWSEWSAVLADRALRASVTGVSSDVLGHEDDWVTCGSSTTVAGPGASAVSG